MCTWITLEGKKRSSGIWVRAITIGINRSEWQGFNKINIFAKWMQAAKSQGENEAKPFVKWAGGKTQMLSKIDRYVPQFTRYFEPFLGGGALFFHLISKFQFIAYLSDANHELINAYNIVKCDVELLIETLERHERNYRRSPSEYYYVLRSKHPVDKLESAARFIALNKTCFNGLYRVNKDGLFNVPIGKYKNPTICDRDQLRRASAGLNCSDTTIATGDYRLALRLANKEDFVYLDPPFNPLSTTSNFVNYTGSGFGEEDQVSLAETFRALDKRGCKVLLSNSDTELTRKLYSGFNQEKVQALRSISCRGSTRGGHRELLVRNY